MPAHNIATDMAVTATATSPLQTLGEIQLCRMSRASSSQRTRLRPLIKVTRKRTKNTNSRNLATMAAVAANTPKPRTPQISATIKNISA